MNSSVTSSRFARLSMIAVICCFVVQAAAAIVNLRAAEPGSPAASPLPALPEAVASFGAVVADDRLYVYGGHIGKAHVHSKKNLSQKFQRLRLSAAGEWETLPAGPGLQSVALAAYGDDVYRVGGLSALNEPEEAENLVSVCDLAKFDPQTQQWTALTPLPEGRSSHDAVVVGSKLYVVGGWNLGKEQVWHKRALALDLSHADAKWVALPEQPFERRALAAAECGGRIYAIGGMNADDEPSTDVHYFDIAKNAWSAGPSLPGKGMNGFGCSAIGSGGRLYCTTMDGGVYRLSADGLTWESVGKLQTPRFFHRLLADGKGSLLAVGGAASGKGHLNSVERFSPAAEQR